MPKPGSSVLNVRDMDTMITSAPPASSALIVRDMDTIITSARSESRHVNIVPSGDINDSKIVKDVHVHSEISSVIG